jgi:hypothetical protein
MPRRNKAAGEADQALVETMLMMVLMGMGKTDE